MPSRPPESLTELLTRLRLWKGEPRQGQRLAALCHDGALQHGLSVALDVRPDELFGPLAQALGGGATRLKLVDVREHPSPELVLSVDGREERWEVGNLGALVESFNQHFAEDRSVRVALVLGEWEDMLQLWCVDRQHLAALSWPVSMAGR